MTEEKLAKKMGSIKPALTASQIMTIVLFLFNDFERVEENMAKLKKEELDELIGISIKCEYPELYVYLTNYKNEHFNFEDKTTFDKLLL